MNDPGLYEWMALRRVAEGGMAKSAGVYLDHGSPVPDHLVSVFDRLTWSGLLVIADGDPLWELRRISLSDAGQGRYLALSTQQRQGSGIEVPGAELGSGGTSRQNPVSRGPGDSCPPVPGEWQEPTA